MVVAPLPGVVQGLQRRGGRAENQRNAETLGAQGGEIACGIAKAVLLFKGAIMLFIDNDDARLFKWREQRRAGADDNARNTGARLQPGVQPLAVIET